MGKTTCPFAFVCIYFAFSLLFCIFFAFPFWLLFPLFFSFILLLCFWILLIFFGICLVFFSSLLILRISYGLVNNIYIYTYLYLHILTEYLVNPPAGSGHPTGLGPPAPSFPGPGLLRGSAADGRVVAVAAAEAHALRLHGDLRGRAQGWGGRRSQLGSGRYNIRITYFSGIYWDFNGI